MRPARPTRPRRGRAALALPFALAASALATALVSGPRRANGDDLEGQRAFVDVVRVLQSPRCVNCHPAGDAPLNGDDARPHAMNVSRTSAASGLPCATCHRERNSPTPHGPPGVHEWRMPPAATPMVFQGKTPRELCLQIKDPARNGGKTLPALREHMAHDAIVTWGWSPGPGRTLPPLTQRETVARVDTWLAAGAPCP